MTAVIGIPIVLILAYFGGWLFFIVIAVISSIALWEFYSIAEEKYTRPLKIPGIIFGFLIQLTFFLYSANLFKAIGLIAGIVLLFVLFCFVAQIYAGIKNALLSIGVTLMGVFYIPFLLLSLTAIRNLAIYPHGIKDSAFIIDSQLFFGTTPDEAGTWLLMSLLLGIWFSDTFAYFVGKAIGRHRLAPKISPKKSIEGSVAGFFGAIIGASGCGMIFIPDFGLLHFVVIGGIIGIMGQYGDLSESLIKRDAGIKDSSSILPGHGGLLDRIDSILFAGPLVYLFILFLTN